MRSLSESPALFQEGKELDIPLCSSDGACHKIEDSHTLLGQTEKELRDHLNNEAGVFDDTVKRG